LDLEPTATDGQPTSVAPRERRLVYLPSEGRREEVLVFDESGMAPGSEIRGPAIIDAHDTTVFVPVDTVASRDRYMNFVLVRNS
jgi:N-methylhydantoinase A/oxoprolinase/acetone carboxylase beta subunit